jgi:hypothetical protein
VTLRRFWITFKATALDLPLGAGGGVGVTAHGYRDALTILQSDLFPSERLPEVDSVIEDVDVSQLDENHVIPNMGNVFRRGIWFPQGYPTGVD